MLTCITTTIAMITITVNCFLNTIRLVPNLILSTTLLGILLYGKYYFHFTNKVFESFTLSI